MIRVTSAEFGEDRQRYEDLAMSEPVIVTRDGRDSIVVISIEEYRRFRPDGSGSVTSHAASGTADAAARGEPAARGDLRRRSEPLRGAPEEQEALAFIERAMDWDERA